MLTRFHPCGKYLRKFIEKKKKVLLYLMVSKISAKVGWAYWVSGEARDLGSGSMWQRVLTSWWLGSREEESMGCCISRVCLQ